MRSPIISLRPELNVVMAMSPEGAVGSNKNPFNHLPWEQSPNKDIEVLKLHTTKTVTVITKKSWELLPKSFKRHLQEQAQAIVILVSKESPLANNLVEEFTIDKMFFLSINEDDSSSFWDQILAKVERIQSTVRYNGGFVSTINYIGGAYFFEKAVAGADNCYITYVNTSKPSPEDIYVNTRILHR